MSADRGRSVAGNGAADLATRFPKLPKGRHHLPPDFIERYQKERMAAAVAEVVRERGIGGLTATHVVITARVSRATFYRYFRNRDECLAFACKAGFEHLFEPVEAVYAGSGPWPLRLREALAALAEAVTMEPALAELCLLAAPTDPAGRRFSGRAVDTLATMLGEGRRETGSVGRSAPRLSEEVLAAGILASIARRLGTGELGEPEELVGELMEVAMAPFLASEEGGRELEAA